MKTIDIYSTPQCGFCQTLKSRLDSENISYQSHDISQDEKAFIEMQKLTDGHMSVPVTIINKGAKAQQVLLGYPEAIKALGLEGSDNVDSKKIKAEQATLTCPKCSHKQKGEIPTTSCVSFYLCENCKETIKPLAKDCCVFCSYADKPCPLKKKDKKCSNQSCDCSTSSCRV